MRLAKHRFTLFLPIVFLLLARSAPPLNAQSIVAWDKTIGGEGYEELEALLPLPDGILIGGSSRSNLSFGNPSDLSWNILIVKTDPDGNTLWERMYGGDQDERLWALIPTMDGGFLAGGYSYSGISGDKTEPSRGDKDVWIFKLDAQGNLIWDKSFGGLYQDELFALKELPNGDFLLGCHSNSEASGDKTEGSRGGHDYWIIRTDAQGKKQWDMTIGGDGYDQINDLEWSADGFLYISGGVGSQANTGEVGLEPARGGIDFWLLKFDPDTRQILWQHRYGGEGEEYPYALWVSPSGHLYFGGRSGSAPAPPGEFNNGKDAPFYGGPSDFWMLELDTDGKKLREWSFGGAGLDDLYAIQEHECGGFAVLGVTDSDVSGNKTSPAHGGYDFWLLHLDADGNPIFQQTIGGAGNDAPTKIAVFPDGSYLFGGHSESNAGLDKTQNAFGLNDYWILRTTCQLAANIAETAALGCSADPVRLDATVPDCPACFYEWNTEETSPIIELPAGTVGSFNVRVCSGEGCVSRDSAFVSSALPLQFDLGTDTILSEGNTLVLGNHNNAWHCLWNTGDTTPTITVSSAGLYAVTVTDANGCTARDQLLVSLKEHRAVWVPNVFAPDGPSGLNNFVTVFANESVRRVVSFQIADRWGELVFRREDFSPNEMNQGWDGYYRGRAAPSAVYVWYGVVEFLNGEQQAFKGSVTIVR